MLNVSRCSIYPIYLVDWWGLGCLANEVTILRDEFHDVNKSIISQVGGVEIFVCFEILSMISGPCHNGMTRPQVADEVTASRMEGSCERIE
jgi:hypothetical protein